MFTSDFDFDLPPDRIAQFAQARGESRLLVLSDNGELRHSMINRFPEMLHPGDLLVVNNTRVIPARLTATGGNDRLKVEIFLAQKLDPSTWACLTKPGRRTPPGAELKLGAGLEAKVVEKLTGGLHRIQFSEPIESHLERIGSVPLPPYIRRPVEAEDQNRYQTVYASHSGAIAAPTAGLHFTRELLTGIASGGVEIAELTLHVGIGTFKPVRSALAHEHQMDEERYEIPRALAAAIERTHLSGKRVVAVGTTVVRALESAVLKGKGRIQAGSGRTDLFIRPGFNFQIVDALLTNFHLPRSSLLMLVCAFGGHERVLRSYREAIRHKYRFYSYGDAMLLESRYGSSKNASARKPDPG
jgi:S-adenosylmethionine:tRNA ribosyltransferase-isomerase